MGLEWITPVATVICTVVSVVVVLFIGFNRICTDYTTKISRVEQKCDDLEKWILKLFENNKSSGEKSFISINKRLEKVEHAVEQLRHQQLEQYNALQDKINRAMGGISE